MEARFAGFRRFLAEEKHASNNTVQSYLRDIAAFDGCFLLQGDEDYKNVTRPMVEDYFGGLERAGRSSVTAMRVRASLNCYFGYLLQKEIVAENPVKHIQVRKQARKMPEILTADEVDRLLDAPDKTSFKGIRDRAMLELMYATGLKATELIELNCSDVNLDVGFVRCRAGKQERYLPLYPSAAACLRAYWGPCRKSALGSDAEEALFLNTNGGRLTRQGFWKIIKQRTKEAGIDKDITPQVLRHSLAIHLLQNGAELKDVQELLGHSDIASTQFYAKVFQNTLMEKYKHIHPRAQNKTV